MREKSDQELLKKTVIEKSRGSDWSAAKAEWLLITIYNTDNHCVCGHAIRENCLIRNRETGDELVVGNVCVNHFKVKQLEVLPACRRSLTSLLKDTGRRTANKELLELAVRLGILSDNEMRRYMDFKTANPALVRSFADRTAFNKSKKEFRLKINSLIVYGFSADRPRCGCRNFAKPRQNGQDLSYFYSCGGGRYADGVWRSPCGFTRNVSHRQNEGLRRTNLNLTEFN